MDHLRLKGKGKDVDKEKGKNGPPETAKGKGKDLDKQKGKNGPPETVKKGKGNNARETESPVKYDEKDKNGHNAASLTATPPPKKPIMTPSPSPAGH